MTNEELSSAVWDKSGGRCGHCDKELVFANRKRIGRGAWEVEHLRPQALGGTNHLNNLVAACWTCNVQKGTFSTRTHRLALAPQLASRTSRRRLRTAGNALIPGAIVAGLTYWYLRAHGPTEEQQKQMPPEEVNRISWRNVLLPLAAGALAVGVIVVLAEYSRNA